MLALEKEMRVGYCRSEKHPTDDSHNWNATRATPINAPIGHAVKDIRVAHYSAKHGRCPLI